MSRNSKTTNALLWTLQLLLAALFGYAGGLKLILPAAVLEQGPFPLSAGFLRFIALAELLGALGLVLPGLFRIRGDLTPLAAAGLVIIMAGATVLTALGFGLAAAVLPFLAGLGALIVCLGRGGVALRLSRAPALHPTVLKHR